MLPIFVLIGTMIASSAMAQETELYDPSIPRNAVDGVVKLYGAGGPHTAFRKVADAWQKKTGHTVEIVAGPEKSWSQEAQADADIIWGTSEQSMTAFLQTYKTFSSEQVDPIYIRPAIIAVKTGNPKKITDFDDLLKDGVKIVVTEGAGVANTSGTGVWEDVAGRLGSLEDMRAFRKNIVAFASGSGASFKVFKEMNADVWITWPNWPVNNPAVLEAVDLPDDRKVWRDVNVALAPDADPDAQSFLDYLVTEEAQAIMHQEGWVR